MNCRLATCFYLCCLSIGAYAVPPTVSNIRASQRAGTKFVDVTYDLADPDSALVTVQVELSSDSGVSYDLPLRSVSGAIGAGVTPGANRLVTWNAGNDWNGNFSNKCRVRIWAFDNSTPVPPPGMVYIPPGTFRMGWESASVIGGDVTLTQGYHMDRYETSGAPWAEVANWGTQNGYEGFGGTFVAANHPVHSMTWFAAARWCNARSQKDGLTPCYYTDAALTTIWKTGTVAPFVKWTANGYRLPTDAEWERAARGGLDRKVYPWGDTINGSMANYSGSGDPFDGANLGTTPVGFYNGSQTPAGVNMANGYGLYDMAGNVWEWCYDWFASPPYGQTDPVGPALGIRGRVLRGGALNDSTRSLQCANRNNTPELTIINFGFRCVCGL